MAASLVGILGQLVRVRRGIAGLKSLTCELQSLLASKGMLDADIQQAIQRLKLAIDAADAEIPAAPDAPVDVHPDRQQP